jgi:latrophilin 2
LWSIEGCSKTNIESDLLTTVCECDHLTNFAALMDTSGREKNIKLKSILTHSCCGLSIIGLFLTIVLNLRHKRNSDRNLMTKEREKLRVIVILNLCICLLINNLLVILVMDKTDNKVLFISCIESVYLYRISIINW